MLGGTSLAPTGKPPVPGQFDDASPATSVTTYDKFGRPKLAGIGRSNEGGGGAGGGGNGESAESGRETEGRGSTSGDTGKEWDRNRCAWIAYVGVFRVCDCVLCVGVFRLCVFCVFASVCVLVRMLRLCVVCFCECVRASLAILVLCVCGFAIVGNDGG